MMHRTAEFLRSCGTFYIATAENDQPRVRPFGALDEFEGKLYLITSNKKPVFAQLTANPKVEICAFKDGKWIRVSGELIDDGRTEAKAAMLDKYPMLKGMYSAEDDNTQVLYFKNGEAVISSFGGAPETLAF